MPTSGPYTHGPYSPVVGSLLPVVVVALIVTSHLWRTPDHPSIPRWYRLALLLCLAAAAGNYVAFGEFRYGSYMNEWDVAHYYTGTKYAPELGYFHQYEAIWLADHDTGSRSSASRIRNLHNYETVATSDVLDRAGEIRARFSPERWRDFCADVAWLKMQLPAERWSLLTDDHGHNAPPTWTAAVGTITDWLPVRSPVGRWALLLVDPLFLLLSIAAIAWAYGLEAATLCAVLFGTHYFFSWGHLKGSIVRTDFVAFSLFAACFLKKERAYLAGGCAAVAACSRAFPVFFLAGPLVVLVSRWVRDRKLDGLLSRFFLSVTVTAATGCAYAVVKFHGTSMFVDWAAKMALHVDSHASWNVGFRTIFNTTLDVGAGADPSVIDTHLTRWETLALWSARAGILLPALYFMRFMLPSAAYCFSYIVMFYVVAPVHYYAMVLALPLLYWAAEPPSWSRTVGLGWLLLTGALGYLLYFGWSPLHGLPLFEGNGLGFTNTLYMSSFIMLTTLHLIAHSVRRARADRTTPGRGQVEPTLDVLERFS
jgi:hypothetical protein